MPTLFKMSDDKKTEDIPSVVFTQTTSEAPPRKTKKYVIIAVSTILGAVIILAAILVGMYMFTQGQKEIIQYAMQFGGNSKQDVTSDPNENVVQYHVSDPSREAWIVNDFSRDIQLLKIVSNGQTNCYVSALNRSNAMDPSQISGPDTSDVKDGVSLMYRSSDTPIADTSFLGKTARATCQGISVYWLYPYCMNGDVNMATNGTKPGNYKTKRETTLTRNKREAPYYCQNYVRYTHPTTGVQTVIPCVTGCCQTVCACNMTYSWVVQNGQIKCSWTIHACSLQVPDLVYYDGFCRGPSGLNCAGADHDCFCQT